MSRDIMLALGPSSVSSNWRKLREKLQKGNQQQQQRLQQTNGVKRKRADLKSGPTSGLRNTKAVDGKKKHHNAQAIRPAKRRNMGKTESKSTATTHDSLARDHDIPRDALAAAYGSFEAPLPETLYNESDVLNGGLHPTHKAGKYIALDCEMVGTGAPPHYTDNVLARVSAVNYNGEQLYDSYVLPPPNIVVRDYRTRYSGVRPADLEPGNGARTFATVQADVARLLQGRVLVGHDLRHDMHALVLSHLRHDVRDTSRHARFRRKSGGAAPALRNLVHSELGLTIQEREHSSVEDARAAMMLFRKDKAAFEEEKPRPGKGRNGVVAKKGVVEKVKQGLADRTGASSIKGVVKGEADEDESVDVSEDDADLQDREEDGEGGGVTEARPKAKRKRKTKKRTKRK